MKNTSSGTAPNTGAPQDQAAAAPGAIDIEALIAHAKEKIPANLAPMLDKIVLSGMRIMFDKDSHKMALAELDKEGPLSQRLSNGMITLMYMLWKQSNQTIPPQLVVPATLILTLRAFQFLQMSQDPEATKEVLGEAVADSVQGVMDRFGATQDAIPSLLKGGAPGPQAGAPAAAPGGAAPGGAAPQPQPQGGGMLDATQGA